MLRTPRLILLICSLALAASSLSCAGAPSPAPAPPTYTRATVFDPAKRYSLVFHDEFNGDQLDRKLWRTEMRWGPETQGLLEHYSPEALRVRNGVLTITASKSKSGRPYTSGAVASFDSFHFTYGYVEMRAKTPAGQGLFPCFWLLPRDRSGSDEIDVLELLGNEPGRAFFTLHYFDGPKRGKYHSWYDGPDFSTGFHTFGADWQPGSVVWYVDGVERYRVKNVHVPSIPMYLIANFSVGGPWGGPPDDTAPFPSDFQIDYIRVYQGRASDSSTVSADDASQSQKGEAAPVSAQE
jgi:beta-glucanase (GH16 family)